MSDARPVVLFLCVHNAGRSQIAAAFARKLAGDEVEVFSAGSAPSEQLNPAVVAAMAEVGIDIANESPTKLTDAMALMADVIITMGCGDACPYYPGKRYDDWVVEDPAGLGVDAVRAIRNDIEQRVRVLIDQLQSSER